MLFLFRQLAFLLTVFLAAGTARSNSHSVSALDFEGVWQCTENCGCQATTSRAEISRNENKIDEFIVSTACGGVSPAAFAPKSGQIEGHMRSEVWKYSAFLSSNGTALEWRPDGGGVSTKWIRAPQAPDFPSHWRCVSNCGCQPKNGDFTLIARDENDPQKLVATNECGNSSPAIRISQSVILTTKWNVEGTLSQDGTRIIWKDGALWERSPDDIELERRIPYWFSRAFRCEFQEGRNPFSSKEPEQPHEICDDGDALIMNAMLCMSGLNHACETVLNSQDEDGRWWRSPRKRLERPSEPVEGLRKVEGKLESEFYPGQSTFSVDHAVGVWAYSISQEKSEQFSAWTKWIDKNERCTWFCGTNAHGGALASPRFCKHDSCVFSPIDCPMMQLVADRFSQTIPFCSIGFNPLLGANYVAQSVRADIERLLNRIPRGVPLRDEVQRPWRLALQHYDRVFADFNTIRSKADQAIARKIGIGKIISELNLRINEKGFSRHNAMLTILLLEKMGYGSVQLAASARELAAKQPNNPFYEFVAHRKNRGDRMLRLILQECPSKKAEMGNLKPRREWRWERNDDEDGWKRRDTMYWECIFVARLWKSQPELIPGLNDFNVIEEGAIKQYEEARKQLEFAQRNMSQASEQLRRTIEDLIRNPPIIIITPFPVPEPPLPRRPFVDNGVRFPF